MQTLARLVGQLGKALKSDCSVDKVAKDESRSVWLSVEEKSCSFIEKRLGKRRVALNALNNSLFEITCKRHRVNMRVYLRNSYSISTSIRHQ